MFLPALLLTLDKYRSWRVGMVVPATNGTTKPIRSAVRTTFHCLLRSDLVAELNQIVIDGFNDELPQLAKLVQPLLGLFHHRLIAVTM